MKPRYIALILGLVGCVLAIGFVMVGGNPRDRVSLDSVSEIGEGLFHSVHKVGGLLTAVSSKEEMEIGDKIHRRAFGSSDKEGLEASPIGRYLNEVGSRLAEHLKRKDIRYKFHIVEGYQPDAFAAPGGHVYVTVGLLMAVRSESELAAIMGHEITHVDARHCIGVIQYKIKTDKILGTDQDTLADAGYSLLLRPAYSEVQEAEADVGGVYLAYESGYHPHGIIHAFERIEKSELAGAYKGMSVTPVDDTLKAIAGMVGRYFASHPGALDRIDKIKKYIAENNLIKPDSRFYVGRKNYDEKISYKQKRYKEEFRKDYPVIEDAKPEPAKADAAPAPAGEEKLLDEVYTIHGTIKRGMTVDEVEKILPKTSQAFKYDDRLGYKNIMFHDMKNNAKTETAGLWIEVKSGMVKGSRIIR